MYSLSPLRKKPKIHGSNLVRGKNFDQKSDSPPTRPHRETIRKVPRVQRRIQFGQLVNGMNHGDVLWVPCTPDKRYATRDDLIWTEM